MFNLMDNRREVEFNGKKFVTYHGQPFDRGSADSYYGRGRDPHFYPEGTGHGERVSLAQGTPEWEAYMAGYDYNERFGDKKDWG